ncbi:hypothetical protein NC99_41090 [Sunxiuqinia dokdonensis]|uniref:Uncharacterized protein n=1 Tax=Sunxiuqinia dokdonensis TaxID=1409788 RepID=A0A0L8V3K3_9BACT|nr:hypothetical protein NC99_41090 [Sunxiuqinia dokdonensis]
MNKQATKVHPVAKPFTTKNLKNALNRGHFFLLNPTAFVHSGKAHRSKIVDNRSGNN